MQVYLNGKFIDHTEATIPVDDRGFLFADGVYEVIRIYGGRTFLMEPHMQRLRSGLRALHMADAIVDELDGIAERLIRDNAVDGDGTVYIQVTRGVAPRRHAFPDPAVSPTAYVLAKPFSQYPDDYFETGVAAISVPDTRWTRCDIKSIALLPNVLANQQAHHAGAFEALFVKDGVLIEGSHSNLFGVLDGTLMTYPSCNYILSGITRTLILEMARKLNIAVAEAPIPWERIEDVEELFLSGTTTEVMPVSHVDGRVIGGGTRGPVTTRLQQAYRERTHG
ncbi:MAG TPA: D-amino acid aminotransferase [Longimicrobiales bacterium]|nr:D-amino acid aminotransferase [Longimicrobiales bacterium]